MMQIVHNVRIGNKLVELSLTPALHTETGDAIYLVDGYLEQYQLGQNEDGGWEFLTGVPEPLAMLEDEISNVIEDRL